MDYACHREAKEGFQHNKTVITVVAMVLGVIWLNEVGWHIPPIRFWRLSFL